MAAPLAEIPKQERRYFSAQGFEKLGPPQPKDWLAEHKESGQTFAQFRQVTQARPTGKILYLRPVGAMGGQLEATRAYCEVFFQRPVKLLPELKPGKGRHDFFVKKYQLLASDLLERMVPDLPADGLAEVAVTNVDLYPSEDWSYVFGIAKPDKGVGVFSFARYDPKFFGQSRPADWEKLRLRRSSRVVAHETCHLFGMAHCIDYNCLMNGVNHLNELDSRSFFLCPVCLRKLRYRLGFDAGKRFEDLRNFCNKQGLQPESEWLGRKLAEKESP
ncbi:hypothetical protein ABS71_10820 [bacterium SCN 62-11]|nr:hypothetical protein [Candidatus Eremiobacteraeota bacterium]ODT67466.1 MAG: hypothetical protein ABS71_10820 [bacterium SCN 62-11]